MSVMRSRTREIMKQSKHDRNLAVSYFILALSWLFIAIIGNNSSRVLGIIMAPLWFTNVIVYYRRHRRQNKKADCSDPNK